MSEHRARPDDEDDQLCKDCRLPITWDGPGPNDWSHEWEWDL